VRIDQLALLFALVIAANLVLIIALQLPLPGRRRGRIPGSDGSTRADGGARGTATDEGRDEARVAAGDSGAGLPAPVYQRMTRVVSFMFVGSAIAIAVLTGAPIQTDVIVLLVFGLILVELFADVLPPSAMGRLRLPVEAVIALVFLTVLIALTGGQGSPYFFGYLLLVGAAALSRAGLWAALLALASSASYIVAIVIAGGAQTPSPGELGLVAFNLIAIALVMYVASVVGREQRQAREAALSLSRFDSLTGLYSRNYFTSGLDQEIRRATRTGRPFALAMLDLDGLKAVNDRFGHEWGDRLLRSVADALRGDVRATDVAARLGGDEFALMLPETDLDGAVLVAEKVLADIARIALPHDREVVRTRASIGIVTFPDDGRSAPELLRRADMAMYEAKRRGRNQIVRYARDGGARGGNVPPASPGRAPWEPT